MTLTSISRNLLRGTGLITGVIALSGCALGSLPAGYSDIEQQTVSDLNTSNYAPRSQNEREAIATQDEFAQTAFWSKEYNLNPADLEAAVNLSSMLRKMGNPGKSIEVAQHTRALYPRDIDLMTELAASKLALNQSRDAVELLDKALGARPQNARLWSLKGAALDQLEQFPQARQHYSRALQLAPSDPNILANVGLSYALEGDPRTAEVWLRRASAMPGAGPNVRQNLALVLGLQGKLEESEQWASQDLDQLSAEQNRSYIQSLRGPSANRTGAQPTAHLRSPQPRQQSRQPQQQIQHGQKAQRPTKLGYQQQSQYRPATPQQYKPQPSQSRLRGDIPARPQTQTPKRASSSPAATAPRQYGMASGIAPLKPKASSQRPETRITMAPDAGTMAGAPQTASDMARAVMAQRKNGHVGATLKPTRAGAQAALKQPASEQSQNVLEQIGNKNMPKQVLAQQQRQQLHARAQQQYQQRQQQYRGPQSAPGQYQQAPYGMPQQNYNYPPQAGGYPQQQQYPAPAPQRPTRTRRR